MATGAFNGMSSRAEVSTSAVPIISVCRASLILSPGISATSFSAVLELRSRFDDAGAQPLVDMQPGEQEGLAMPRVQTREPAIGRGQRADRMRNIRRLGAALVGQHLDHRVVAVRQQARPVGRDLAPKLLSRTLADERALGAVAIDQPFAFEHVERFADGGARDAAFGRQIVHRRGLLGDRPVAGLDAAAEQARKLDVTRDDASIQIDGRSSCAARPSFRFRSLSCAIPEAIPSYCAICHKADL